MSFFDRVTNRDDNRNTAIVKLPKPKSKVALDPPIANVLKYIIDSGEKGVSTTDLLNTGINIRQLRQTIRVLKTDGAPIESKMGEARTRAGHISSRIIHYVYKVWK